MGMKPWKNSSVKIGLPNFVLVIFHSKVRNDLAVQLKLMSAISRPLSIQFAIAQHVRLQKSSKYRIHALKKKIETTWLR